MENDLILDVGLHLGEDTDFYLEKGFRVVAIEAVPSLAKNAEQRLAHFIEKRQLTILNGAITEIDGPVTFWVNPTHSVFGTANPDWKTRNDRMGAPSVQTTVQGRNFSGILEEHGIPYYLKIDIEGSDMLCLEALKRFRSRPKYVSIESTKTSWSELLREFAVFRELGYSRFKIVPQHLVPLQKCPFPALEGNYVDHHFESGSSGLFGDEAPGHWIDETEAIGVYRRIFRHYRFRGDDSIVRRLGLSPRFIPTAGWFDTHAKLMS